MKFKKYIKYLLLIIIILMSAYIFSDKNIAVNSEIVILDQNDEEIIKINNGHKTNTISSIPPQVSKIVIAIEDETFYSHHGFDIYGIFSAIKTNILNGTSIGGSTITQQYIKNTYLSNSKSIFRKLKELYLSVRLESQRSKDEILANYLECIYFGNNVYGITNASKYYYNKTLEELTTSEIISLVALFNSPSNYSNSITLWNKAKNNYAKRLYDKTIISYNEYEDALKDISLNINEQYLNSNMLFYVDTVLEEFKKLKYKCLFNNKIIIKTKYDKDAEKVSSKENTNYAAISTNKEGYITSLIGNSNYYDSSYNIVLNGKRDIGSTIKPLLYYEAIKCNLNDKNYSAPYSFKYGNETITVTNSSNYYTNSYIDMYEALAISDNTYAVRTHLKLGMKTLANHLKAYGINASSIPSLALGSVGMSLYDLCRIYTQFFSFSYQNVRTIHQIVTSNKTIDYNPSIKTILDKTIIKQVDNLLKAPFDSSISNSTCSFLNSSLKTPCKGKTGLTDYDSYMIGYTDNNLVCVWAGNVDNDYLADSSIKRLPKILFRDLINSLENDVV